MNGIWESVKFFIGTHRTASLVTAGVLGVTAVGAGGYGIYNIATAKTEPESVEQPAEEYEAQDIEIPEFKNIKITSESLEKDITIYISDENDNTISGEAFQVKLLTPEAAEGLQSYVDAIKDLDEQIAEYTKGYGEEPEQTASAEGDDSALPVDGEGIDFSKSNKDKEEKSDKKSEEKSKEKSEESEAEDEVVNSIDVSEVSSDTDMYLQILKERNVDVTVTDEEGNVIETQHGDASTDPFYQLLLDKETAVQAYTVALNQAEGIVYTDDDQDGVIKESEVKPGDYMLCLVNDLDSTTSFEPTTYTTEANVKDKVEFKVQKEITKEIKKDVASEDGQKAAEAAVPVEATLKDTQEFVESRKEENGVSYKATTDVVTPKNTASASKAAVKNGAKKVTSVTHPLKATAPTTFTITYNYQLQDYEGKNVGEAVKITDETVAKDALPKYKPDETKDVSGVIYTLTNPPTYEKANAAKTYTFIYKATAPAAKAKHTVRVYYNLAGTKVPQPSKDVTLEEGATYEITAEATYSKDNVDYKLSSDSPAKGTIGTADSEIVFEYTRVEAQPAAPTQPTNPADKDKEKKDDAGEGAGDGEGTGVKATFRANGAVATSFVAQNRFLAARSRKVIGANVNTAGKPGTETATLDMTYAGGTFTIKGSTNVGSVTVNGTAVTMTNGTGTFKATQNGDYVLAGVATFSDGEKDNTLTVTYTVSGFGTASTEKLKDSKGNQLYLDAEGKTEATAADYAAGKTFYYKEVTYKYYGWQNIDGNTYYFNKNAEKVTGSQVIQGVQYEFGADGVLVVKGNGIDVSKYQGNIDWKSAKSAINFAIIRCGYRGMYDGQLHEDPYFYKNMSGAKSAGVNVGVYIYSTALNEGEAVQEASMAVAMAQKAGGCSYPIYLDMEDGVRGQSKLSTEQRMAIVNAFVTTVQSSGYKAGLYCSKNWMTNRMNPGAIPGSCSVWIAQYNTSCTYSGRKNMWQYSSKGSVPGIKGHVDMNKSF